MTKFADLGDLPEDERIAIVGRSAAAGNIVGFIVEDDEKADRYLMKLRLQQHHIRIIDRGPGPVTGTILVRIGPAES